MLLIIGLKAVFFYLEDEIFLIHIMDTVPVLRLTTLKITKINYNLAGCINISEQ